LEKKESQKVTKMHGFIPIFMILITAEKKAVNKVTRWTTGLQCPAEVEMFFITDSELLLAGRSGNRIPVRR
jgi:hypothetical protein